MVHETQTLARNLDSTEFSTFDGTTTVLAVGAYQLNEDTKQREGNIFFYGVQVDEGARMERSYRSWCF